MTRDADRESDSARDAHAADRALLDRCLQHDADAWSDFVERFSRLIYSVVYKTLQRHGAGAGEDAVDELFHRTFLALYDKNYRKLRQWTGRCSLASWVRLVSTTTVIDSLRRRRRDTVSFDDAFATAEPLLDARPDPLDLVLSGQRVLAVRAALSDLRPDDRELLVMLFRDERPAPEVASALGISPGALYTRKNRALGRLRSLLTGHEAL